MFLRPKAFARARPHGDAGLARSGGSTQRVLPLQVRDQWTGRTLLLLVTLTLFIPSLGVIAGVFAVTQPGIRGRGAALVALGVAMLVVWSAVLRLLWPLV